MSFPASAHVALLVILCFARLAASQVVLVEAESFADTGGWVVDQQFMDQMGSPFLLAHGLGVPVADAVTTVQFPAVGDYHLYVRTRDWVSPYAPGQFRVLLDGQPLNTVFGTTGGGRWGWQDGGVVHVAKPQVAVALHDLTGFEGRCDALVFVGGQGQAPPDEAKALAAFRKKALGLPDTPPDAGTYDLVVVGGGVAGSCAAVAAARLNLKVALIQDRPVLGGNASSDVGLNLAGLTRGGAFPRNADIVYQMVGTDADRLAVVQAERNIDLHLNTHAFAVEMAKGRISAVIAREVLTGRELRFPAPLFVDCTGDGTIGFLAGADYHSGREGRHQTGESLAPERPDAMHMGTTNLWWARQDTGPSTFPKCPWALRFTEQSQPEPLTGNLMTHASWDWESGFYLDSVKDAEFIRDYNFRAAYGTWDFFKNQARHKDLYRNWQLQHMGYIGGKRESRRLLGDLILTQQDLQQTRLYPDGCVNTNWPIDLHMPDPEVSRYFRFAEFRSVNILPVVPSYPIPFRCLYSRNISNLMMAGRDISVTHVALGCVRVMGTTGMMGTVAGRAAFLCKRNQCTPRDLYQNHLKDLLHLLQHPSVFSS